MGSKNIFKKIFKRKNKEDKENSGGKKVVNYSEMISDVDTSKMSFKEKMGLKMFKRMSQKKQDKILREAINPAQVMKNKDKILAQIDEMIKSGQIDKGQAEAVKSRMGLR